MKTNIRAELFLFYQPLSFGWGAFKGFGYLK
jgi:hypothetical protein